MPLNIRSEIVNQLAERLAARRQGKTDAVRIALQNELRRLDEAMPLRDRVRPLQQRVLSRPATGLEAYKTFYDELSGECVMFVDASAIVDALGHAQ
jgi:antitoxin VapB